MFFLITLQHFTSRTSFFISFLVFFFFVFFLCSFIVIIVCYISLNQSNSSRFLSARSLSMYIYSSISLYLCIIPRIYLSFIWHIIFSFYSRLIHWIVRGGAFSFISFQLAMYVYTLHPWRSLFLSGQYYIRLPFSIHHQRLEIHFLSTVSYKPSRVHATPLTFLPLLQYLYMPYSKLTGSENSQKMSIWEKTFELFRTYLFLKPLQNLDNSWTANKLDKFENLESFDRF